MFFACVCWDRPHVGETRERVHHDHLAYLAQKRDVVHAGGPFENTDGGIVGTLIVVNVAGEAEARAFIDAESFHKAGVFETVKVRRWCQMQPEVSKGADATVDAEADVRLRQEAQNVPAMLKRHAADPDPRRARPKPTGSHC